MIFSDPTTNSIASSFANTSIISSTNSSISSLSGDNNPPRLASIIASDDCQIRDVEPNPSGPVQKSCIIACQDCFIQGDRSDHRLIAGSRDCSLTTNFGFGSGEPQVILGSISSTSGQDTLINCQNVNASQQNSYTQTTCISCVNMGTIASTRNLGIRNVYLSSNNVLSSPGGGNNLIKAWNADIQAFSGCTMLADLQTAGPVLTPTANNQFVCRFTGTGAGTDGYVFYSNSALTSGAVMANGGTWAAISDENKKENLVRLDDVECSNICKKLSSMDVCKYNYIGNPQEQVCYGPTAQDWHREFSSELIPIARKENIVTEDGEVVEEFCLDEEGNQIYDSKPAKDPCVIEYSDMLGVLMATVKDLNRRISTLENGSTGATGVSVNYQPEYTFDSSYYDVSRQRFRNGDDPYDVFGITRIEINSSFITLYFRNEDYMISWRSQNRNIVFDAPNINTWEGTKTLGPNEEYSISPSFYYISYNPLPFEQQESLADFVVKANNDGQLNITLY